MRCLPLLVFLLAVAGSAEPLQFGAADLIASIKAGDVDAVRRFLNAGLSPNVVTEDSRAVPALTVAVRHGRSDIVALLVGAGADLEARGGSNQNALLSAAEGNHTASLQVLVDAGADVNALRRPRRNGLDVGYREALHRGGGHAAGGRRTHRRPDAGRQHRAAVGRR